ncbi:DUF3231 family protein [Brevibacillus nitrificans]|uniref:DUF3231 family protein n=1 Tax=Brevibacillus nitrificans TaxID=651560 RepID=UPI002E21136D|nr:DUF3231 family protein [Brevibacillus nitrificans]
METIAEDQTNPLQQVTYLAQNDLDKLTSAEQGKIWATYVGNTMSVCVLSYMLNHVKDQEVKNILEHAMQLSKQFLQSLKGIFAKENYPVPVGFTQEDVDIQAPRLFEDDFYLHYLKYVAKAGISLYGIAIPLVTRDDTRQFFTSCIDQTVKLINSVNTALLKKGLLTRPPYIPYPEAVDFVEKHSYHNGYFGRVRPLQALEITHLYDNVENNATSKAVLVGFSQVAKSNQSKAYFRRGKEIATKHYETFSGILQEEGLTSPPILDQLVTTSTSAPFSDRLMLFHKLDMYAVRIRAYGNALSMCARHDVATKYARFLVEVGNYVEDGSNLLIENGWLEQPPQAVDRNALTSNRH